MKFWITKNSEVSVVEQLFTQIKIGLASGDLIAGEKLPSTRELARRFGIHPNTAAAAYRRLAAERLVEARKGSGMFVKGNAAGSENGSDVHLLMADFVSRAASAGYSRPEIEDAVHKWLRKGIGRKLIVVESDHGLGSIILEEVRSATGLTGTLTGIDGVSTHAADELNVFAALYDEKEKIAPLISAKNRIVFLDVNSVAQGLASAGRPNVDISIAVVSCWGQFIAYARIYLLAAKIDADSLIIRSTSDAGWQRGLSAASVVICDSHTATQLSDLPNLKVFKIIPDRSIDELKHALL